MSGANFEKLCLINSLLIGFICFLTITHETIFFERWRPKFDQKRFSQFWENHILWMKNMRISINKTKTMVMSRLPPPPPSLITCQGRLLEHVQYFKYLSSMFNDNGKTSAEINLRLPNTGYLYHTVNKKLICKIKIPKEIKTLEFKTLMSQPLRTLMKPGHYIQVTSVPNKDSKWVT